MRGSLSPPVSRTGENCFEYKKRDGLDEESVNFWISASWRIVRRGRRAVRLGALGREWGGDGEGMGRE